MCTVDKHRKHCLSEGNRLGLADTFLSDSILELWHDNSSDLLNRLSSAAYVFGFVDYRQSEKLQ